MIQTSLSLKYAPGKHTARLNPIHQGAPRLPRGNILKGCKDFYLNIKALSVLYVPSSLDCPPQTRHAARLNPIHQGTFFFFFITLKPRVE